VCLPTGKRKSSMCYAEENLCAASEEFQLCRRAAVKPSRHVSPLC